jgi:hypothetical protein
MSNLPTKYLQEIARYDELTVNIATDADYREAVNWLLGCKQLKSKIESHYKAVRRPLNEARRVNREQEKEAVGRLTHPLAALSVAIMEWEEQNEILDTEHGIEPVKARTHRTRETKSVRVENMKELVEAVARGDCSLKVLEPNIPELNRMLRAHGQLFSVAGCAVDVNRTIVTKA